MRIRSLETFLVTPRWLFVKIATDEGVEGWGEASLEGHGEVVRAAVHAYEDLLHGQDPRQIERLWHEMTRSGFYRGGPVFGSAVAGIDQALWDIKGKALGVPVYDLLGGPVREKVRVYGWIGGDDPTGIAEAVEAQVDAGLTAVKMNACGPVGHIGTSADTDAILARAQAARDALGPDRDFALDFHGRVSPAYARRLLPLLEPLHPMFVEEPTTPENGTANLARLVQGSSVPIATGERLYSRWDMLPVMQAGVAVVQPDLSHAGGISEVRRIATMAETFGIALAPHCPLGPLALAASLQVDVATPNVLIQEQSIGIHYNAGTNELLDYMVDPQTFAFTDGYIRRPESPGLGITVDEAAVRRADEVGHRWRTPTWAHPDGALAEW